MTSSGLDDFFIPDEDDDNPGRLTSPPSGGTPSAPRDERAPLAPGSAGSLSAPGAGPRDAGSQNVSVTSTGPVLSPQTPGPARSAAPGQVPGQPGITAPATAVPRPEPAATPPASPAAAPTPTAAPAPGAPPAPARQVRTREDQLSAALATFMRISPDVEAAALVSLDGFTMASALPEGMHEDRVGAMSAAILGLGERAAIELGRGKLSQVFIEGDTGYVLLMAAGDRAVLTALARLEAKLGLLLYDMRDVAEAIADILG